MDTVLPRNGEDSDDGDLVPTWLLEDPGAKEVAKERVWRMALGTIPPAMEGFWTPFCGMSSE